MLKLEDKLDAASLQHLKFSKKFELADSVKKRWRCCHPIREGSELSAEILDN